MSGIIGKNANRSSGVIGTAAEGIADDAITLAKMAGGTDGQIITYDASGDPVAVGPGSDGEVLTSTGAGSPPAFEAAAFDDNKLQTNIALLGFKIAVNGSLAKYNLVDQIVDEYTDATGVDASASTTNETLIAGAYSGVVGSNPTGGASVDTSVSGYRTHVFSANASLSVSGSGNVTILVIGGGGSGGCYYAGGGGSGGLIYKATHGLTANTYDVVIGAGGAAATCSIPGAVGNSGVDTTWTINGGAVEFTAKGGGGGGYEGGDSAVDGGSGGGQGYSTAAGGASTQSAQSGDSGTYGFGFAGGTGIAGPNYNSGGGGGAGSVGAPGIAANSGNGGTGKDYSAIFGTVVGDSGWFASGGGGGEVSNGNAVKGTASAGGGSNGSEDGTAGGAAQANTGGGSGGGSSTSSYLNSGAGGSGVILVRYATTTFETPGGNLTLQSNDTTASTANPDYADMIMLMENAEGTATLNTDIKGYISEDSGVTFTQGTLVEEGTWGTDKKIIAFHDLDISAQTGSAMCYKITTHNQSAGSKETKIHATSIGWR